MNTLILTGAESSMHELLDATIPSKQHYASVHGYDFMSLRSFSADPKCGFDSNHIGFLKTSITFKMLRYYNHVMWLDADSIVTNTKYKIEDFVQGKGCYTVSYDWMFYQSFSTGNFIVSKTQDTEELFNIFLKVSSQRLNDIMADQGAMNLICNASPRYKEFFNIIPHKYLNSVPSFMVNTKTWRDDNNRSGIIQPWTPDSFLAHFTGASTAERIEIIKNNLLGL